MIAKKDQGKISNFTYKVVKWNNEASAKEGISFIKLKLQSLIGGQIKNNRRLIQTNIGVRIKRWPCSTD